MSTLKTNEETEEDIMKAFFDLTPVELELMEMFWKASEPLSFGEILDYVNSILGKNWKNQTLNTYLSKMRTTGLVDVERSSYHYRYFAARTKDEYVHQWTKNLVKESYGNSISNFVAAFTAGEEISEEEGERLRKLLRK